VEDDQTRGDRLPAIVEYLKIERARSDRAEGVIHFHYHEAARPEPPAPPPVDVLTKYTPHLILATWSMIVATGVVIAFIMLASAIMTIMVSTAVGAVAVAASVRSLRMSKIDAQMLKSRSRR
jgi:hypothetical protein